LAQAILALVVGERSMLLMETRSIAIVFLKWVRTQALHRTAA